MTNNSNPAPDRGCAVSDPIRDASHGRVIMASAKLGQWLSAALDDRGVCEEMKADIREWFSAGEPQTDANTRASEARIAQLEGALFQSRVQPWMMACFGSAISGDMLERADRFTEEALELAQTMPGFTSERAHALVDYVFGREIGEREQEVGGVMVTLAALCLAAGLDMHAAGETELARINRPEIIEKIRAKQAAKPTGSALPIARTASAGEE